MDILDILRSDGSVTVNKKLISKLKGGLVTAGFLSELIARYKYHERKGQVKEGGWFYCTIDKVEEQLGIGRGQQDSVIKELLALGLIEKKSMGLPCRRHFRIRTAKLLKFLFNDQVEQEEQTGLSDSCKQECDKSAGSFVEKGQAYNTNNNTKLKSTIQPGMKEEEVGVKEVLHYITAKIKVNKLTKGYLLAKDLEDYSAEVIKKACDIAVWTQQERGNYRQGDPKAGVNINSYKFIRCFIEQAQELLAEESKGGGKDERLATGYQGVNEECKSDEGARLTSRAKELLREGKVSL